MGLFQSYLGTLYKSSSGTISVHMTKRRPGGGGKVGCFVGLLSFDIDNVSEHCD